MVEIQKENNDLNLFFFGFQAKVIRGKRKKDTGGDKNKLYDYKKIKSLKEGSDIPRKKQ